MIVGINLVHDGVEAGLVPWLGNIWLILIGEGVAAQSDKTKY